MFDNHKLSQWKYLFIVVACVTLSSCSKKEPSLSSSPQFTLLTAIESCDEKSIEELNRSNPDLISKSLPNVNCKQESSVFEVEDCLDRGSMNALMLASTAACEKAVGLALDAGINPNAVSYSGNTALVYAVMSASKINTKGVVSVKENIDDDDSSRENGNQINIKQQDKKRLKDRLKKSHKNSILAIIQTLIQAGANPNYIRPDKHPLTDFTNDAEILEILKSSKY